jgi:nicotinamide-nucleotide amidase
VAIEMALGSLKHSHAQIAVAITGIAGPNSDGSDKPVGMVCFAIASLDKEPKSVTKYFDGDRFFVKKEAVLFGLNEIISYGSDK